MNTPLELILEIAEALVADPSILVWRRPSLPQDVAEAFIAELFKAEFAVVVIPTGSRLSPLTANERYARQILVLAR